MKIFESYRIREMEVKNKVVMAPMCMYSSDNSGCVKDFHVTHYATRAIGGVGTIIVEATAIEPKGRISDRDLGIWSDEHIDGLKRITTEAHTYGAKIGIQLAHAGRKHVVDGSVPVAPSPIPFDEDSLVPTELSLDEIEDLIQWFGDGARRAVEAGFDFVEIHGAHGYLIHEFLSPFSNKREDAFGGKTEERIHFLNRIVEKVDSVVPSLMPVLLRVSASDYVEDGIDLYEMIQLINKLNRRVDMVHVSSGGMANVAIDVYPGYQVSFAERIQDECNIPTISVGYITHIEMMEEIIKNNRSSMVALGRLLLRNPYFMLQEMHKRGYEEMLPRQYSRGF